MLAHVSTVYRNDRNTTTYHIYHVARMHVCIKQCKHMASLYNHMEDILGSFSKGELRGLLRTLTAMSHHILSLDAVRSTIVGIRAKPNICQHNFGNNRL